VKPLRIVVLLSLGGLFFACIDPALQVSELAESMGDIGPPGPDIDPNVDSGSPMEEICDEPSGMAFFLNANDDGGFQCTVVGGKAREPRDFEWSVTVTGKKQSAGNTTQEILGNLCTKANADGKPGKSTGGLKGCGKGAGGCTLIDWDFTKNTAETLLIKEYKQPDGTSRWLPEMGDILVNGKAVPVMGNPYSSPSKANAKQDVPVEVIVPSFSNQNKATLKADLGAGGLAFLEKMISYYAAHEAQHVCTVRKYLGQDMSMLWNMPPAPVTPAGPPPGFAKPEDAIKSAVAEFVKEYNRIKGEFSQENKYFHALEDAYRKQQGYKSLAVGGDTYLCPQLPEDYMWLSGVMPDGTRFEADVCSTHGVEANIKFP
jgi:hypothetical protein